MSAQVVELLFFAIIAFLIINKLISILGGTSEGGLFGKSFFGEPAGLKDVTNTAKKEQSKLRYDLKDCIIFDNYELIVTNLRKIEERIPNFKIERFIAQSKIAFGLIIEASVEKNLEDIKKLVDERFIEQLNSISTNYSKIDNIANLSAKVFDIYTFGNTVFIKVLFTGKNILSNITNLNEIWTFSKSFMNRNPGWYLVNIESPQ